MSLKLMSFVRLLPYLLVSACFAAADNSSAAASSPSLDQMLPPMPNMRHAEAVQLDVVQAVEGLRSQDLTLAPRLLFVSPDSPYSPFAGTGGQRNVSFLCAASARLGYATASLSPPGEGRAFLDAMGVATFDERLVLRLPTVQLPTLHDIVQRFEQAWFNWREDLYNEHAREGTMAAYDKAESALRAALEANAEGAETQDIWLSDPPMDALSVVAFAQHLGATLEEQRSDVCVVGLPQHAFAANLATHNKATKVVWYVQDVQVSADNAVVVQQAHVIGCSELSVLRKFEHEVLRYPHHVAPNGIAGARFFHEHGIDQRAREQLGLPHDAFVVGHVAAFGAEKGQLTVAQAFASLQAEVPEAYLVFVGRGDGSDYGQSVHALANDHVQFLGDRDDVASLLPVFDVFVSASYHEGFGLTVAEAMAASRPLALTSIPALQTLAGDDALYFVPGDAEGLRAALSTFRSPQVRQSFAERGHARLHQQGYDSSTMLYAFMHALEAISSP